MSRNIKKVRTGNPVSYEYIEDKEPTLEQRIEFTKEIWSWLGIERIPTKEDIEDENYLEREAIMCMRKLAKINDLRTLQQIKDSGINDPRLSPYTNEEREFLGLN